MDELRRRARRRLVGAIVLAMAAAVVLPILLESNPKPLGDEVSVRIPPIDSGKFVNPLSPAPGPATKSSTKAAPASAASVTPGPTTQAPSTSAPTAPSTSASAAPSAAAPVASGKIETPATPRDAANPPADSARSDSKPATAQGDAGATTDVPRQDSNAAKEAPAKTETRTEAHTEAPVKSEPPVKTEAPPKTDAPKSGVQAKTATGNESRAATPKSDTVARSASADTAPRPASGGLAVQVGAFADAKAATDLVSTLRGQGFAGYGETVPTTHGPVRRVRVGPFATRAEADAAAARLKAAGYERAIVVGK